MTSGSCTLVAGASTVTLTAAGTLSLPPIQFDGWQGATCDGVRPTPPATGGQVTFTNPTSAKSCTAVFDVGL